MGDVVGRGRTPFDGAAGRPAGPVPSRVALALAVALALGLATAGPARAKARRAKAAPARPTAGTAARRTSDVYSFTDPGGVIHFTNAPTDSRWKKMTPVEDLPVIAYRPGVARKSPAPVVPVIARAPLGEVRVGPPAPGTGRGGAKRGSLPPVEVVRLVDASARRHAVEAELVHAVIRAESGYDGSAVSPAGAMGLMQLMPGTAELVGVADAFEPGQNIEGGVRYLRMMLDRFGDTSLALAAYNAGPGAVDEHRGIPPFRETEDYVDRVLRYRDEFYYTGALARVRGLDRPQVRLATASYARRR